MAKIKPFSFTERQSTTRKPIVEDPVFQFKAKPPPPSTNQALFTQKQEEEKERKKRIEEAAKKKLEQSALPPRMAEHA